MSEDDAVAAYRAARRARMRQGQLPYLKAAGVGLSLLLTSAVIFPIFTPACGCGGPNGRRASCQSNLKQIGLAMTQYEQDNDETQPAYVSAGGRGWREALYPYTKAAAVFQCPDDQRDRSHDSPDNMPKSYAANHLGPDAGHQERGSFAAPDAVPVTIAMFGSPAKTVTVTDTRGYSGSEWNIIAPAFLPETGRELYAHISKHPFYQHPSGTLNCLFADGHVKSLKPMTTLAPVNLWTRDNAPFTGQELVNARTILKHAESE